MNKENSNIHDTAVIDNPCRIGKNTRIWHFCHVSKGAKIGNNCILGQNVFIGEDVTIGNGVKIQNNVSIFKGVEISDNVFCGPSVVFTNVLKPRAFIEKKNQFKKTIVEFGVTLGANSVVVCGNKLGKFSMIGASSVVTKDILDFALIVGNPGKHVGWVSRDGEKLNLPLINDNVNPVIEKCESSGKIYKLIKTKLFEE